VNNCLFVTDLHGHTDRYRKLWKLIEEERPEAVFLGGDLLPHGLVARKSLDISHQDFVGNFLVPEFGRLRDQIKQSYPRIFLILGNDDPRFEEPAVLAGAADGLWEYIHNRSVWFGPYTIYGYSFVPPTPFPLKDWERYDVSRFVDPGCISPEEGYYSVPISETDKKYATIQNDLKELTGKMDLAQSIFLFHSPPYQTALDRAALDGKMVDHVPLDVHVGSIAIQRFIEEHQPLITLHGHVHESARLTGAWKEQIGRTYAFSAAHDGPELALVRFNPQKPEQATRELI